MRLDINVKIFQHFINLYNIIIIIQKCTQQFQSYSRKIFPTGGYEIHNLYKNTVAIVIFPSSDDAFQTRSSSFHSCKSILESM